ncbi:MAG: pentapeptide repeat-containing protein [Devosia sp.]
MSDDKQGQEPPAPSRPGAEAKAFNAAMGTFGIALVVFIIGVVVGFPIATFGVEFLTNNAGMVFGLLFGFLVLVLVIAAGVTIFRQQIWQGLFKRGEVEMERFARPLSEVARFAALQKVQEATDSARDLAELVLARYAWVSTRRWLMATITAFIAAIAALAGSALLFQQNQLLRTQIGLMQDQNSRIEEQNRFIQSQIELGEAQRSTSIVPEILEIGAQVAAEVANINTYAGDVPSIALLTPALQARITAASVAARPYRFLRSPLTDLDENAMMSSGLLRRTDLAASGIIREQISGTIGNVDMTGEQAGVMVDRPLSPERGQLISMLIYQGLTDFDTLNGADFSFAEVRAATIARSLRFNLSSLRFANFDRQLFVAAEFNGAYLEHARFRFADINYSQFGVGSLLPIVGMDGPGLSRGAQLSGTDFSNALIKNVTFDGSRGFGINFDAAMLHKVTFNAASLAGSTFRNSLFGVVDFTGADLKSVDFDGAVVFDGAFLDTLATQAAPDSFVRERFEIAPITADEFAQHPRWSNAWLDGLEEQQAYRITRVGSFE